MYITTQELHSRYGDTLSQIVGSGDIAANELVERAITDATAEVDSYLQGRFLLPIPFTVPVLTQIAGDIAIYRLLVLRPNQTVEDARSRYEDAIKRLEQIRKGFLDLGLPLKDNPASIGHVQITGDRRLFGRSNLRDA